MTLMVVLAVFALVVAFGIGYVVGRAFAPKNVTVEHPWPDEERCESILGGAAMVQCRFKAEHKGVHRAWWDHRDWPFVDGDVIVIQIQ